MADRNPRKKYRCVVEFSVECDGWSDELYKRLFPSPKELKEAVQHALETYNYTEDIWSFTDVHIKDVPIDILNTPTIDIKAGIEEDSEDE